MEKTSRHKNQKWAFVLPRVKKLNNGRKTDENPHKMLENRPITANSFVVYTLNPNLELPGISNKVTALLKPSK